MCVCVYTMHIYIYCITDGIVVCACLSMYGIGFQQFGMLLGKCLYVIIFICVDSI